MHTDKQMVTIVKTVIELGKNLGLSLIAEGVETESHVEELNRLDCDQIQGYFFSRPILFESLVELLNSKTQKGKLIESILT
jgi:EAL domain-containing protein (putative c-di-GMP-specific phosphodiesterase class I)